MQAEKTENANSAEWQSVLKDRASKITSVRNDIFTLNKLQLAFNVLLGLCAAAGLIVSMFIDGTARVVVTLVSIVLIIVFAVYNFAIRTVAPMNVLQFTCVDGEKIYTFQILSQKRSAFSDGKNHIETERGDVKRLPSLYFPHCKYDFFADMTATARGIENGLDVFDGVLAVKNKKYKCRIAFDGEIPVFGRIGGVRIKYFNVNNPKEKFIVPTELKRAVKSLDVAFPKLNGLHVRDDATNFKNGRG